MYLYSNSYCFSLFLHCSTPRPDHLIDSWTVTTELSNLLGPVNTSALIFLCHHFWTNKWWRPAVASRRRLRSIDQHRHYSYHQLDEPRVIQRFRWENVAQRVKKIIWKCFARRKYTTPVALQFHNTPVHCHQRSELSGCGGLETAYGRLVQKSLSDSQKSMSLFWHLTV